MKPFTGWRDRVVVVIANCVLKLSSRQLQRTLQDLIKLGMLSADLTKENNDGEA